MGCILYADDLVIISPSLCAPQRMIDLCTDELDKIDMCINPEKCGILQFGPRFAKPCAPISWQGNAIKYCNKAKYPDVTQSFNMSLNF